MANNNLDYIPKNSWKVRAVDAWRWFRRRRGWVQIALVLLVLGVIGAITGAGDEPQEAADRDRPTATREAKTPTTEGGPTTTKPAKDTDLALAFEMCKEFVERQLKSPGSAEYPDYWDKDGEVTVVMTGPKQYRVASHVDSENSFGASLRTPFECETRDNGDDTWTPIEVTLAE